ncbi:MAG: FAD-dependent oxidoreductase [Cyclobacteriaceae bacterium]
MNSRESLAIVGTGIAGMGAAHLLKDHFDITLFEKNNYVGGHTNTVFVDEDEKIIPIDTGFMVFNKVTYPNLIDLFNDLKVPIKETDMSFSVQHRPTGLEYNGSGFSGLFAQKRNYLNPKFLKMLLDINQFNSQSIKDLESGDFDQCSLKDYIAAKGYGKNFVEKYIVPMSSAIWSTPSKVTLNFPFVTIVRFMKNHGMLGLNTQHQWYTVVNGSETYKNRIIAPFKDRIHTSKGVVGVIRQSQNVELITRDGQIHHFDKVIIAAHGDEALNMLTNPTNDERQLLSKFRYQPNIATLHTDHSIMPKNKKIWSAWNYNIIEQGGITKPSTIYYMNSLQHVSKNNDYFVSINDQGLISPRKVIKEIAYTHPIFNLEAIQAQSKLSSLNKSGPVYFCGSYFKYGFHEDAYASAVNLSKDILKNLSEPSNKDERDSALMPV